MTAPAHAAQEKTETFTLENGLEVILIPNHRIPAVCHMLWFRVGAADDPPGKSGLAHYLEHMMFRGTKQHPPGAYADLIARAGGDQNAFTGHDTTVYHVCIAKEHLKLVMELEADRLQHLSFDPKDALREREVILEERRSRIENKPYALLAEQINAAFYLHYPYRYPVIGWEHEMRALEREDVMAFYRRHYHPGNAMLIVSGDVSANELKTLASAYYGTLPRGSSEGNARQDEPPHRAERRVELRHALVKQPEWQRGYLAPSYAYGEKAQVMPLLVLAHVLGGGKTSRLYKSVVAAQRLASAAGADYNGFARGPAEFTLSATPSREENIPALEAAMDAEIETLLEGGIAADEMARAKTLLKAESVYARDGLGGMAHIMGWMRLAGLPADTFERWGEMVDAVTAESVVDAARAVLQRKQSVTGVLLPQTQKTGAKDAR